MSYFYRDKIGVVLPELTWVLWEDASPNISIAGYVEVDIEHADLSVMNYSNIVDTLLMTTIFVSRLKLHWKRVRRGVNF